MFEFLSGCAGLFTAIFNAIIAQGYFLMLVAVIVFLVMFGIFGAMSHRLRKV